MSGIAIVSPNVVERFVRQVIANKLNGESNGARIRFQTQAIHQQIKIPDNDLALKEILLALGIKGTLNANIAPIDVAFSLPMSGLNLKIRHTKPDLFDVVAKWRVTQLTASSKQLNIRVPKGLFDRDFDIDSKPVQIGLMAKSPPIRVELKLQVRLTSSGSKLRLVAFNTNLNAQQEGLHPNFDFKIGPLTVDKSPLVLEIESNGRTLRAEEPEIREQLERLEPQFTAVLRREIEDQIQQYFNDAASEFSKQAPFKINFKTDKLVSQPGMNPAVSQLLKGIEAEFIFDSLEYVHNLDLFTAHIASHICFDGQCLFNTQTSNIGTDDLKPLSRTQEIGMLIYESWLQRVVNDDAFQKRIRAYYDAEAKAPGVDIGQSGVKLHLNPKTKSIDAVFNLSIDIKKTSLSKNSNTMWKKVVDRTKKRIGDLWETLFGTGKRVVIPVEVHLNFDGYEKNAKGETEMVFHSTLPFRKDGTIANSYGYPSNIAELTKLVREDFMTAIETTFKDVVPAVIRIPVPAEIPVQGIKLPLKKILVSPNNGLIFTAEVPEVPIK